MYICLPSLVIDLEFVLRVGLAQPRGRRGWLVDEYPFPRVNSEFGLGSAPREGRVGTCGIFISASMSTHVHS